MFLLLACTENNLIDREEPARGDDSATDSAPGDSDSGPVDTGTPQDEDCGEDPLPGFAGVVGECALEPSVGTFTPKVEWEWSKNKGNPGYDQVMTTPAVGDLDGDGVPEVVFTAYTGMNWNGAGPLVILDGATGKEEFSAMSVDGHGFYGCGGVALGDLEGDGKPDICLPGTSKAVVCLEGDGSFKWAAGSELTGYGAVALADMDLDGKAEVALGRQVFHADGSVAWVGKGGQGGQSAWWAGQNASTSFFANLDKDAELELVAGNTVYDTDGSELWTDKGSDGFAAVADLNLDGSPEVIKVVDGTVQRASATGTVAWTKNPGLGGKYGPPTIADFDGDGLPEIGVAGASAYAVLEADGSTLWTVAVTDASSNMTGSAVFDFEGDGSAEVVYADEQTLWVLDGQSGAVELAETGHASATAFEYPVIADADADGSAEIVLASNNAYISGWTGVRLVGDADASWRPGRPTWNQHAYSITNIEDDLSVPTTRLEAWDAGTNSFRSGDGAAPGLDAPDLSPLPLEVCELSCEDGVIVVPVHVGNLGAADAPAGTVLTLEGVIGGTTFTLESRTLADPVLAGTFSAAEIFVVPNPETLDQLVVTVSSGELQCDTSDDSQVLSGPFCR